MDQVYATTSGNSSIRRINVNIAATTVDEYKMLKDAGIGTYVLFQETYHRETYKKMHSGPKADYDWHTTAMDRAFAAGIDDVGLGVLFGLYDWRFETVGLLMHAQYLDKTYGGRASHHFLPQVTSGLRYLTRQFPSSCQRR